MPSSICSPPLAKAPNRVLSRDFLLDAVSRDEDAPSDRLIDVLISWVREKVEEEPKKLKLIVAVHGYGYKSKPKFNFAAL